MAGFATRPVWELLTFPLDISASLSHIALYGVRHPLLDTNLFCARYCVIIGYTTQ